MKKNKVYRFAYNAFHTDKYSDKTEQQHLQCMQEGMEYDNKGSKD